MLTVTKVSNPMWCDAAHTQIFCQVAFAESLGFDLPAGTSVPFNCMPSDPEPHGKQLWKDLITGKYGAISEYVAPRSNPAIEKPGPNVVG